MAASSCAIGGIFGNAVASFTVVTDDCPSRILVVALGLTRGSVGIVMGTGSGGGFCTDSGTGVACSSVIHRFGAGSFYLVCGDL